MNKQSLYWGFLWLTLSFSLSSQFLSAQDSLLNENQLSSLENRVYTIGFPDDYHPYSFKDAQGRAQGLFVELWKLLAEKNKLSFRYVFFPLKSSADELQKLKLDWIGAWPQQYSHKLESMFVFSNDIFYQSTVALYHSPNTENLTLHQKLTLIKPPLEQDNSGHVWRGESLLIEPQLTKLGLNTQLIRIDFAPQRASYLWGLAKTNYHIGTKLWLESLWKKILPSELIRIEERWIQDERFTYFQNHHFPFWLSPQEYQWIHQKKSVKLGIRRYLKPLEYQISSENFRGLSLRYAQVLSKKIGLHFEIVPLENYEELLEKWENKDIDLLLLSFTESFQNSNALISAPYFKFPINFYVHQKEFSLNTQDAPPEGRPREHKILAYYQDYQSLLQSFPFIPKEQKAFHSFDEAVIALNNQDVDFLLSDDYGSGLGYIQDIDRFYSKAFMQNVSFIVQKDHEVLFHILDKSLFSLKPSERNEIEETWLRTWQGYSFFKTYSGLISSIAFFSFVGVLILLVWILYLRNELHHQEHLSHVFTQYQEETQRAYQSKSDFLSNISHEIRTPINGIIGASELLERTELTQKQRELQMMVQSSSRTLLEIVNDILDYSKLEAHKLSLKIIEFSLYELITETVQTFEAQMKDHPQVNFRYVLSDSEYDRFWGDPIRIKQILLNLLSNAAKFTYKGHILLTVFPSQEINLEEWEFYFGVEDSGVGMSHETIGKIFQAFEQYIPQNSPQIPRGTGLGLTICQSLIDLMGGEGLHLDSQLNLGSLFYFYLRLQISRSTSALKYSTPTFLELPSPKNKLTTTKNSSLGKSQLSLRENKKSTINPQAQQQILIAEDNEINLKIFYQLLENFFPTMDTAINGQDVLEKAREKSYDLIWMDLQMPILDGLGATKALRELEKKEKRSASYIIAITAYDLPGQLEICLTAGMDDYLAKPVSFDKVQRVIDKWRENRLIQNKELLLQEDESQPQEHPKVLSSLLKELPFVHVEQKLRELLVDAHTYEEWLIRFYQTSFEELYKPWEKALQNPQQSPPGEFAAFNHQLSGALSNLGAYSLVQKLKQLEACEKNQTLDEEDILKSETQKELFFFFEYIKKNLIEQKISIEPTHLPEPWDCIDALLESLPSRRPQVYRPQLEKLRKLKFPDNPRAEEWQRQILQAMESFRFQEAQRLLKELKNSLVDTKNQG